MTFKELSIYHLFYFFIDVPLIYNIILVSGVQYDSISLQIILHLKAL